MMRDNNMVRGNTTTTTERQHSTTASSDICRMNKFVYLTNCFAYYVTLFHFVCVVLVLCHLVDLLVAVGIPVIRMFPYGNK